MVTKQTRIIFEVGDIAGIRVQCHHCKGEIVRTVSESRTLPKTCLLCGILWENNGALHRFQSLPNDLQGVLEELRDERINVSATIRLELEGETIES